MSKKNWLTDQAGERGSDAVCRTEDLKGILNQLADQIADADRRHGESLRHIHSRIADLGGQAEQARSSLPPHFAPTFARIEESLGQLAERIVEADRQRQGTRAAGADEAVPTRYAAEPRISFTFAPEPPRQNPVEDASASSAPAAPVPATAKEEPWDRESADALTRLYETGEASPPDKELRTDAPVLPSLAPIAPVAAFAPAPVMMAAVGAPGVDRLWFDERFSEVTRAFEDRLSTFNPQESLGLLEQRFGELEQRFATALDGVVRTSDLEGLRHIETQISDIFGTLEQTETRLQRLNEIEGQISALGNRLSTEAVATLVSRAMPTDDELTTFAEAAAERAAERVATRIVANLPAAPVAPLVTVPAGGEESRERLERLQGLLQSFMDERRRGEEMTAGMLDTMQGAMQHLLDRMDQLEHAQSSAPAPMAAAEVQPDFLRPRPADGEPAPQRASASPRERIEPRLDTAEPRVQAQHDAEPDVRPASAGNRDDFIAAARRAARQVANGSPAAEAPAGGEAGPSPVRSGAPKAPAGAAVRTRLAGNKSGAAGQRSSMLLVACIAALLVTGGFMLYAKGFRSSGGIAAKTERRLLTTETEAADKAEAEAAASKRKTRTIEEEAPQPQQPKAVPGRQSGNQSGNATDAIELNPSPYRAANAESGDLGPSVAAILKAQQQQRMAELSQQAGQRVAASGQPPAAGGEQAATEGAAETEAQPPAAMPPVGIGPNSLRSAASKGDPSAQFEVAARFQEGKGIAQDFAQAAAWYQRSAGQGFAVAQYRLANLYERGLGVQADPARARTWYKRAADLGNVKAMHNLGVMSAGRGGADYATALHWFRLAADRGLADSQYNLAVLIEGGHGGEANLGEAYKWLSLAARSGDRDAARRRDAVRPKLEPAVAQAIDAQVAAWRATPVDMIVNDPRAAGDLWRRRAAASPG